MARDGGLRQLFAQHLPEAHWQSVETWSTGSGVPDAEYCFPGGHQGWIEFKTTEAIAVSISPGQVAWAERRLRAGGRISLAVRQKAEPGKRRAARDALYFYHGSAFRNVLNDGLKVKPLGLWTGNPGGWDWAKIKLLLIMK